MTPTELYILYGFLGFMSLMLVAMFGFLVRLAISVGKIEGQLNGLTDRINGLESRIERLEEQMLALSKEVAEVKGMLTSLNERVDWLMRHHHNDGGQVVIIPAEEVAVGDN